MSARWDEWLAAVRRREWDSRWIPDSIGWMAVTDHCWDVFCCQWLLVAWAAIVGME
jgi:hypothetical protein